MNYECHITVPTEYAEKAAEVARSLHWKTSEIARDPVLGDKNFYYLTTHQNDLMVMINRMEHCLGLLRKEEVPVLREKIEIIIHDVRHTKPTYTQIEELAKTIYAGWSGSAGYVPWRDAGNSMMQVEARRQARTQLENTK